MGGKCENKAIANKNISYRQDVVEISADQTNLGANANRKSQDLSMLKSSIFNLFFKEYSQNIWTGCDSGVNFQEFLESMEGEVYSKDWCFRISKNKKMEWLYILFVGQYAIAYTDETCKTPVAYFDLNFTKLDYVQIEMGDDQKQKNYYG